jgi:hypothetical protein
MARRIAIAVFVLALLVFLPPFINLQRYQARITQSLSGAIGRKVSFSQVHLRLVPQPGFTFSNFVVAEDAAFGLEPILRADEVTASLRLASLWRGRLEIAKLSFDSPSLNLTRDPHGFWSFGGSLKQAATVPAAPTSERRIQGAPRFPYIEASDARVNFKFGQTKQPFSLVEADFSLWLASENRWEMRLKARPVRTDASLGDTGTLRAEASILRAHNEPIENVPLKASLHWENAQLGQLTWLLTGADRGWRGDVDFRSDMDGTPRRLHVNTRATLNGFRRYDIATAESLGVNVDCRADLIRQSSTDSLHFNAESLQCVLPMAKGSLSVSGRASWAEQQYDLAAMATDVPMESLVRFYRRAKLNVSDDLRAAGTVEGELQFKPNAPCPVGSLRVRDVRFTDASRKMDMAVGGFTIASPSPRRSRVPSPSCLVSTPAGVSFGAKDILQLGLDWQPARLAVNLNGSAESESLLAALKSFGLIARDYHAQGSLGVNASLIMEPHGFAHPRWKGTVTTAKLALPQDITLRDATLDFLGDQVSLRQFSTDLPDLDTTVSGSMRWPVRCDAPPCELNFALHATSLDMEAANRAFNPAYRKRNWLYLPRFFGGSEAQKSPVSLLLAFRGNGTLQLDRLTARRLTVNDFSAAVSWLGDHATLRNVRGRTFDGSVSGTAELDFSPSFSAGGEFALSNADLASSATLISVPWAQGRGTLQGKFSFAGADRTHIADSLHADMHFTMQNGSLRHFGPRGDLPFRTWSGDAEIASRTLRITRSSLRAGNDTLSLTGTVGSDLVVDMTATTPATVTSITGTLSAPVVTTSTTTTYSASNPQDATTAPAKKHD